MKHLAGSGGDDGVDMTSITETALEPGGMSSISEIMQGQAGEMSPMGYASPFGDPTADELGIGGGSGSALGPGLADMKTMSAFDAPMGAPFTPSRGSFIGPGFTPTHPTVGDPGFLGESSPALGGVTQLDKFKNLLAPTLYKGQGISEAPLTPITPTPGIGVGQTDPATGVPALVGDPNALQNWLASLFERSSPAGPSALSRRTRR
tara:strand:+ start:1179 stop:1796 length:618 start_codon:yes stop_codon:yes gene_type:complete